MALQGAVVSSCLTHQHHFAGMSLAAWLFLPQSLTMVPTTHTFLLIHTELPGENFYLTEAGWKCFMQMFYGKCSLHNINVYHGKIFILPKVKQNGRAFLQGSCDSHLIHLSPQGRFCPSRVIAVFPQV